MLTAVRWMFSKLVSPIWRSVEEERGGELFTGAAVLEDIRHLRGSVVTQLCLDYGMIDGSIYFTSAEVLGGVPIKQGDLVNCIAVRGGSQGGWTALRVEKSADAWESEGKSSLESETMQLRPLIGTVTSYDGNGGYINQNTFFPRDSLSEGYEPMKGDWVQAKYVINPSQWTTQAQSVAPLRYSRLDKVKVTSVHGNSGVVEDTVFFCLDTLLLPANYRPTPGDLVNLVMVESTQSFYTWRALCIAPCGPSEKKPSVVIYSEADFMALLENKGGLDVSTYGNFGDLMMGERRELVFWIQNKGFETQRLKCCEFANWDYEKQFSLVYINGSKMQHEASSPAPDTAPSEKSTEENSATQDGEKRGNVEASKAVVGLRREASEVEIPPGQRISITVACDSKILGCCAELLLLHFSSFTIGRRLHVAVGSEDEALLKPALPYVPLDRTSSSVPIYDHVITVSAPKDPPKLTKRRLPNFLANFPVPQALKDCVELQSDVLVAQPSLGEVLSAANMHARFSTLLWLEELHAEKEIQEFTINGAILKKGSTYLHLEVLGLAEGRPNLNIGDKIVLKKPLSDGMVVEIIGYVVEINGEDVSLRVNYDFQRSYLGEPLDIEFSYNRLTTRRCHHALAQVKPFAEILFPTRVIAQAPQWTGKWIEDAETEENEAQVMENGNISIVSVDMKTKGTQTKDSSLPSKRVPCEGHFFNPNLNAPQKEAVKRILSGECRPTPYILFGPPGTGKTITLIEAILQVYHFLPSSRVLVCTPSNSAADLICSRLHDSGFLDSAILARVNASCRQEEAIPDVLRSYSRAGEDIRHACFHRIVVSTCSSAGMFHNVCVQVGHFTHIFLDEAGQAMEPEALIPISLVSETDGQIVLAGDPRQLGPIVKSKIAAAFGLGVSLLERLMANPLYCRHDWGYNPRLVTKLVHNYRSHEALLTLPSRLFYDGELRVKAPCSVVESLCQWKALPKKGFPLLFHGVRGTEMREGNNPSWFNPAEAVQVMLYCCQLAKKLYNPVNASDIGIIAPYRKQCEKIRLLLSKVGLSDIKVGSVEEFQGQEYLVIILSTVRSNESVQSDDLQSSLGFLSNPKRFNVAITRTKALLLIVGNPHILIRDPCFRSLLEYSFINRAYLGCDPPPSLKDTPVVTEAPSS